MKRFKLITLILMLLAIFSINTYADPTEVELETCTCSDQAIHNTSVLTNALRANSVVQLPAGDFISNPFTINGIDNLTIKGTAATDGTSAQNFI